MKKGRSEMIVAGMVTIVVLAAIGVAFLSSHASKQPTTQSNHTLSKKELNKCSLPQLGNYTVFGQVIDGMDVVDKIADAEVKDNADGSEKSLPVDPVKVLSTVVTTK